MKYARSLRLSFGRFSKTLAILATTLLLISGSGAQGVSQVSPEDFKKLSGLLSEMGPLFQKIHARLQYPPPRSQSHLLPLLPDSTILYAAFPNYGETSHQALTMFREELNENPKLHAWWTQGQMATEGPKIEDALEKFYQLSQYLGDEIVISGSTSQKGDPRIVILAEGAQARAERVPAKGPEGFVREDHTFPASCGFV